MKTVIRNGRIAAAGDVFIGDLSIVDGIIDEIGRDLGRSYDNEINASGKLVIPGGVDVHTHFNLHTGSVVSCDDFYTGTRAAACGGTTTIVDHMGFGPTGCSLHHQLEIYRGYAEGNAVVDFGFHGVIQHVDEDILRELEDMVKIEGIPSFKIYMTYDFKMGDSDALRIMARLKELGGITAVHAENHDIISYLRDKFIREGKTSAIYHALSRPEECESEAVNRIIAAAALAGDASLYVVHLTTSSGLEIIKAAREKGRRVYAETCPQYLLLDESRYLEEGNGGLKYIMSPPLRKKGDIESLWRGIEKGFIKVVATDHCPFKFSVDKQLGRDDFTKCPNGAPGVEERLPLLFSEGVMKGRISLQSFIEVCCTNPARLFGLYPRKGILAPGSDGDIVIMDTEREITLTHGMLHGNADYTAYEGFKLRGYPVMTISRGEVIAKEGEFSGTRGRGKFLRRVL